MISKYLAGSEIYFNNPTELLKVLVTHGLDKNGFEYFKHFQTVTEILIEDNCIKKI